MRLLRGFGASALSIFLLMRCLSWYLSSFPLSRYGHLTPLPPTGDVKCLCRLNPRPAPEAVCLARAHLQAATFIEGILLPLRYASFRMWVVVCIGIFFLRPKAFDHWWEQGKLRNPFWGVDLANYSDFYICPIRHHEPLQSLVEHY